MIDFLVQKLGKARRKKKIELKKLYIKKIDSSDSARKLKCPNSARLGNFIARLSSSPKIPALAHH